jgi:hypothetical protein
MPAGYVDNNGDPYITCVSNMIDDCDDCVGTDVDTYNGAKDCDGVCDGTATISYYYIDYDGDGLGSTPFGYICSADFDGIQLTTPDALVTNQDDTDDSCTLNTYDECGICDDDTSNVCVQDCSDVWGGNAYTYTVYVDTDGDSLGDPSGATLDICSTDGMPAGYVDNNGDPYITCVSNMIDDCDDCVGTDVDTYNGAKDCDGVCDGTATISYYYIDYDGDGLGSTPFGYICSADFDGIQLTIPDALVTNQDDTDDSCTLNTYDECGICDDDTSNVCVQDCSDVWGGNAYTYTVYVDTDGDSLGDPSHAPPQSFAPLYVSTSVPTQSSQSSIILLTQVIYGSPLLST